jgi:hypothetical protein
MGSRWQLSLHYVKNAFIIIGAGMAALLLFGWLLVAIQA